MSRPTLPRHRRHVFRPVLQRFVHATGEAVAMPSDVVVQAFLAATKGGPAIDGTTVTLEDGGLTKNRRGRRFSGVLEVAQVNAATEGRSSVVEVITADGERLYDQVLNVAETTGPAA